MTDTYTLHVFPFSFYSIMARLTASLGASYHKPSKLLHIEPKFVNLRRDENLTESCLLSVNSKGQVPALSNFSRSFRTDFDK